MTKKLPRKLMLRVRASALIFLDSRLSAVQNLASKLGCCDKCASMAYTLGALKRLRRLGLAHNYEQALDRLEQEQVGDRPNRLLATIAADKQSAAINRINRINDYDAVKIDGIRYRHDYNIVSVVDGVQVTVPHLVLSDTDSTKSDTPNNRGSGKVLGTLYTQYEERIINSDPQNRHDVAVNRDIHANMALFWREYYNNLSRTGKTALLLLADSNISANRLMGSGRSDPKTSKLAWQAYYLYRNFGHRDSISGVEFINLVREYILPDNPA